MSGLRGRLRSFLRGDGRCSTPGSRPAGLEQLWAGWRIPYIVDGDPIWTEERLAGRTLFEAIEQSGLPDEETYILWRGRHCFAVLNAYPYTSGHLMVLPKRGVADPLDLTSEEWAELWDGVRDGIAALRQAFRCDGVNVGMNVGRGSGAGVPDHLHVHCLPRWEGDTNFMTTTANVRVLPEALADSWRKLRDAWPRPSEGETGP